MDAEPLWWTGRSVFPAWTSNATTTALAAGVASATLDTGVAAGELGVLSINADVDNSRVLFGPTDPVADPSNGGLFARTATDNLPLRFLVHPGARFFRLYNADPANVTWEYQPIEAQKLWWCARSIFAPWTSDATRVALVANTDSATQDTGCAAGQLGILSVWSQQDNTRILFGATTPVASPVAAMLFRSSISRRLPMRFLVRPESRYFILRGTAAYSVWWQFETIQGG